MNAAKAAVMVRSGGEKAAQDAVGGDARGHMFDERRFLEFAEGVDASRTEILKAGNRLTIDELPMKIFRAEGDELLPNPDVLRDVRKDKIKEEKLDVTERWQLERVKRYMDRINALDYIKRFTREEAAGTLPDRMLEAQEMLDKLRSGKPVEPGDVHEMLTHDLRNELVAQMETGSEVGFYERARTHSDRILLNADIIDFGVDAMRAYAKGMHTISAQQLSGQALFDVAVSVDEPLVVRRREALSDIHRVYETLRQRTMRDQRTAPNPEKLSALAQLHREGVPLVLFGGDEITLSVHPAMEPYLPELVAAVAEACRGRVAVTRARTDAATADDKARVRAHRKAMGQADAAASVLKSFEVALRKLRWRVDEITDPKQRAEAQARVDALKLDQLYADVDDTTGEVKLRRFGSGADVTEAELLGRLADVKRELNKQLGAWG
ncbi:hypothetical protein A7982_13759 [Minicystis rosea]|nr:hypothetical protein A7982_13759 [Minicystis rosea]